MNQERRTGAVAAVSRSYDIHVVEIKLDQQQQHPAALLYIKHHSMSGHIIDGAMVLLHLLLAIRVDMSTAIKHSSIINSVEECSMATIDDRWWRDIHQRAALYLCPFRHSCQQNG